MDISCAFAPVPDTPELTGRLAMGPRPNSWAVVARYTRQLRAFAAMAGAA